MPNASGRRWLRCRTAGPERGRGPHRIFISYRRKDTFGHARLLHDALAARFGRANVFLDTEELHPGDIFPERIERAIRLADQFLLVIGDRWLAVNDADGRRRLDDPTDWVRREIELARAENLRLIPVLVHDASMPSADELPEAIRWISFRQAEVIRDTRFDQDMTGLAARLRKRRPRNRFASLEELRTLATMRALVVNALTKPCSIAFALVIASISIRRGPVFIAIGAVAYLLLTITSFFTLTEAEWVGSQGVEPRSESPSASPITPS